jgi:glutathione synthase/RimK-type ligase-like ATP-grasp enzyme
MPYVLPYNQGSQSAKALAQELGFKRIKLRNSRFNPITRNGFPKKVINWGANTLPENLQGVKILNHPDACTRACNKLTAFETLQGKVSIPEFTTDREKATEWLEQGKIVVERHLLRANSGRGIRIVENKEDLQDAPLYVMYVKKKHEFRIHVFNGECFDIQAKKRKNEVPDEQVNWQVRNLDGGFIFAREGIALINMPPELLDDCEKAVTELGLDFGAVDVAWNEREQKGYILEVNTACGLEGTTLDNYVNKFKEFYRI